ncbi:DUF1343 domain-containing protein [soil metagenome]
MSPAVQLPIDRLPELWPDRLRGARVGAVLHPASVTGALEHASEVMARLSGDLFELAALFGPQHGFLGQTQDNMVEWGSYRHPRWDIPVHSLYGEHREPTAAMLDGLDALVVDLQDVGARYYTFTWTLYLCMKAAEVHGVEVVVLDRPNPINGVTFEGPTLDPEYRSFVGLHPIAARHGRTLGELAALFQEEAFPGARLTVLPMRGWRREMWYDQTGLPWVLPSPNMPTLATATVYPGMCLLEATNVSEGRGTTRPFELFGAPWIDARELVAALEGRDLPGVVFREAYFQPTFQKHAGELCAGAQIHVIDRDVFLPFRTGIEILRQVSERHPREFRWNDPPYEYEFRRLPIEILLGGPLADWFP